WNDGSSRRRDWFRNLRKRLSARAVGPQRQARSSTARRGRRGYNEGGWIRNNSEYCGSRSDCTSTAKMKLTRPILGLVALGLVGFGLYRRTHPPNAAALDGGNGPVIEIHSIAITNNLDLGQFTVDAKSTHDVPITADESQMRNARLLGYFSVTGQNLQVILLDETQYARF